MGKKIPFDADTIADKIALIKAEIDSGTSMSLAIKKAGLSRDSFLFKTISQDPRFFEIAAVNKARIIRNRYGIKSARGRRLTDAEISEINKQCRRTGLASVTRKRQ